MPSIIENRKRTMLEELRNALKQAESIDILTAYFYFSGYNELANELKDKKIRILVGKSIDPDLIADLSNDVRTNLEESLDEYVMQRYSKKSNSEKKRIFIQSFVGMFNKSALSEQFDGIDNQNVFRMFIEKLNNGTLEIRINAESNHAKAYIITNSAYHSNFGNQKGAVLMGSSNFTYSGLIGQKEINEKFIDNQKYDEYMKEFEDYWADSNIIDINDFTKEMHEKLWIYQKPKPFNIFVRILYELFNTVDDRQIKYPSQISHGQFTDLIYQIDAIKYGIDCINKNNGVIIADVVGLGKSIVASAIAKNMTDVDKTVIIAPPHLKDQWEEYGFEFGLVGHRVESSGKIEELHKELAQHHSPILFIIDEAHRYRNEVTDTYQYLHQLTRSHAQNKVILLTATPYNNRPQDLFALVKLFQMPSHSTINTVDNLSVRFRELIAQYNTLEKQGKKDLTEKIKQELGVLSEKLRVLIEPVVIRRSRIDLTEIKEYADDLKIQQIQFAEVEGPELVNYELGDIQDLYIRTLEKLSNDFTSARYNPTSYLINPGEFMSKYGELFFATDLRLIQSNLAKLVKRLLVMRFESSKAAFYTSLVSFISYYNKFVKWWEIGYVPILKAGHLEDPDEDEIEETLCEINDNEENLDIKAIRKKAIPIPKEMFKDELIDAIHSDIQLLTALKREWFPTDEIGDDPKFAEVKRQIDNMLAENSQRKIVIFSYFFTTAEYVYNQLKSCGYRALLYSGASKKAERNIVRQNFDASYKQSDQRDDFDIIVATDALSEGFNLNRAGIVINYDIPYNPTRVVQRIGRINRINKMMYNKIYIYNLFPTVIGEEHIAIKSISKLKMLLINNIVGSDTRTLTPDEDLKSYFKQQFNDADTSSAERSWDNEYRNIFNSIRHNQKLMDEVYKIPERVRIIRKFPSVEGWTRSGRGVCTEDICSNIDVQGGFKEAVISFVKRGNHSLFAIAEKGSEEACIKSAHEVLCLFKAEPDEESFPWDFITEKTLAILKEKIKEAYPKIKLDQRKGKAIDNLTMLREYVPTERDYIDDLLNIIKDYDDLCDSELKYIANLTIKSENAKKIIPELKEEISEHYIIAIKNKAEQIKTQTEIILFTEDLRNV